MMKSMWCRGSHPSMRRSARGVSILTHRGQGAPDVSEALGCTGDRVVHVFLVLEADMVLIADVEKRLEHPANVQAATPDLDRPRPALLARDVLDVQVIQPRGAGADRPDGIHAAACR